jgi:16S rRNA (cytidine1402-2'-O)-methyltransferase
MASGIPAPRWAFEGFLPRKGAERRQRLARIAADDRATVLFEAPARTAATLRDLAEACGADRPAVVCRELTKLHEQVRRGGLAALADGARADPPRGEVTVVVGGKRDDDTTPGEPARVDLAEGRRRVAALVAEGRSRSDAARRIARETGLPRRDLFRDDGPGRDPA